jgi:hypothetical protein
MNAIESVCLSARHLRVDVVVFGVMGEQKRLFRERWIEVRVFVSEEGRERENS